MKYSNRVQKVNGGKDLPSSQNNIGDKKAWPIQLFRVQVGTLENWKNYYTCLKLKDLKEPENKQRS